MAADSVESEEEFKGSSESDLSDGEKNFHSSPKAGEHKKSGSKFGTSVAPGYYPVTSPKGVCLVINIDRYDPDSGFSCRDGSQKDVSRIGALFGGTLDFRMALQTDLRGHEIARCLTKTAYKDHTRFGAFVCFLMAHGTKEAIYGRDGVPQYLKDLTTPFHPNTCPSLSGKPKIFFVQACRGSRAATAVSEDSTSAPVPVTSRGLCPKNSDFLFCYASSEDAPAYRDPQAGSAFVQTLCDVIDAGHQREHLVDLMTEVNRRVRDNPVRAGKRLFLHVVTDTHSQLAYKVSLSPIKAALERQYTLLHACLHSAQSEPETGDLVVEADSSHHALGSCTVQVSQVHLDEHCDALHHPDLDGTRCFVSFHLPGCDMEDTETPLSLPTPRPGKSQPKEFDLSFNFQKTYDYNFDSQYHRRLKLAACLLENSVELPFTVVCESSDEFDESIFMDLGQARVPLLSLVAKNQEIKGTVFPLVSAGETVGSIKVSTNLPCLLRQVYQEFPEHKRELVKFPK